VDSPIQFGLLQPCHMRTKDITMITHVMIATLPNPNITASSYHRSDRSEIFRNLPVLGRCSPAMHRTIIGNPSAMMTDIAQVCIRRIKSSCLVLLPIEFRFIPPQLQILHVHRKRGQSQTSGPVIKDFELPIRLTDLRRRPSESSSKAQPSRFWVSHK
jgi:hypothetical protein